MKKQGNGIKILIIGIVLICLVIGYYYYLSNRKTDKASAETSAELTPVQEMLLYNFERSYPPSPKEVVKLFAEMSKCFYNEEYTEEECEKLALLIQNLYDEELIANKTQEQYLTDLWDDIREMKEQGIVISSFSTSSSTDVEYFSQDGYEWARLYCDFSLRQGTQLTSSNEVFILRKDDEGHWKIFGWELADE